MKAEYDKETDTLTITLRDTRVKESDEIRPGVIADLATMVAWLASKSCKPQKWSNKRAKCSSQSLITNHQSLPPFGVRYWTLGVRRWAPARDSSELDVGVQLLSGD
jgi:hypothetical protein